MENIEEEKWINEEDEGEPEYPIEFSIVSSPNDFNIRTLFDFIESGVVKIPGFQRNFVWDIKRASRLVESIIMGIPIPQLFFFEKSKNEFLVIDGQQRLMTIFYFMKGRFPRLEKRPELRRIIDEKGSVPKGIIDDDAYFIDFDHELGTRYRGEENRLDGLTYEELNKSELGLKTIRCIFIKPQDPKDDTSIYEIFYRLNTGGVNLTPQEIRISLYYSDFYDMLTKVNLDDRWRRLTKPQPDIRMRDMEILLRGFAILFESNLYKAPMISFLNEFSKKARNFNNDKIQYAKSLFEAFLDKCDSLPDQAFQLQSGRFSASVYEAIFKAACEDAYSVNDLVVKPLDPSKLANLKNDVQFLQASGSQTTSKYNVDLRLRRAKQILFS